MAQDYKVWITPPKSEGGLFNTQYSAQPIAKASFTNGPNFAHADGNLGTF
jgi:hypothetical protein